MVLSFFVNRIKSFPIRMEPLETDFRLHVTPDAQHFVESRAHYCFLPIVFNYEMPKPGKAEEGLKQQLPFLSKCLIPFKRHLSLDISMTFQNI